MKKERVPAAFWLLLSTLLPVDILWIIVTSYVSAVFEVWDFYWTSYFSRRRAGPVSVFSNFQLVGSEANFCALFPLLVL